MILYKYYSFQAGLAALKSQQLGFREPKYFNDPFEFSVFADNDVNKLKESVAVLSLTRNPLNALMWAHYGQDHTGFVIGYEVDIEFLSDDKYNLITLKDGNVRYSDSKEPYQNLSEQLHNIWISSQVANSCQTQQERDILKQVFLTKHSVWHYEEEIRVVKRISTLDEEQHEYNSKPYNRYAGITNTIAPMQAMVVIKGLYLFEHKVDIKEVYLGARNPLLNKNIDPQTEGSEVDTSLSSKAQSNCWSIFACSVDPSSWDLKSSQLSSNVLNLFKSSSRLQNDVTMTVFELRAALFSVDSSHQKLSSEDRVKITNVSGEIFVQFDGHFIDHHL